MALDESDQSIRAAAFATVRQLLDTFGHLTARELEGGFQFQGERIPLVNPRRGIFKPRQMRYLLSIKTVFPKPGSRVWYDDQRDVHRQIYEGDEVVDYSFMGDNPDNAENRWLRESMENGVPIIYFLGTAPGVYEVFMPTYIAGWDGRGLKARVAFGLQNPAALLVAEDVAQRRYALRTVKQRLHQATFREAVLDAYRGKCALSGLPEPRLLDAAHIVPDSDEHYGHPIVPNGIPLSRTYHAAFDAHLLGVDPDLRIHVSDRLLRRRDGPTLEALKGLNGKTLLLPRRRQDQPDRERLELRYELFKAAA